VARGNEHGLLARDVGDRQLKVAQPFVQLGGGVADYVDEGIFGLRFGAVSQIVNVLEDGDASGQIGVVHMI